MNLTPMRLRVLRILQQRGAMQANQLAYALIDRRWTPQGATRWIAGYIRPMVQAGLVGVQLKEFGWADLSLTVKGQQCFWEHCVE